MSIESEFNGMQRGIREHTVPSGMAWPMYEDGKPVLLGDATEDCPNVSRISFTKRGFYFNSSHRKGLRRYRYGDAVKRQFSSAPIVAADGMPLRKGETVWEVNGEREFVVSDLPKLGAYQAVVVRLRNGSFATFDPNRLTHESHGTIQQHHTGINGRGKGVGICLGEFKRLATSLFKKETE